MRSDETVTAQIREALIDGTLTARRFNEILRPDGDRCIPGWFMIRDGVVRHTSWSVLTTEYMDAVQKAVQGLRVLEVCAGSGLLAKHMKARGVDWTATDIDSPNPAVQRMSAVDAVNTIDCDVIFASWVPYESNLDMQLALSGKPCIFITEGCGGCTGSEDLWNRADGEVYDIYEWRGEDVSQWDGIHDYTIVTIPKGYAGPFTKYGKT